MNLQDLKKKKPPELLAFAEEQGVEGAASMRRQELMFAILQKVAAADEIITGIGTIEVIPDGFGYLRSTEARSFKRFFRRKRRSSMSRSLATVSLF